MSRRRLPDFLIIGAMKAATTTLYRDLGAHPGIFFPADKEPEDLIKEDVLTARGLNSYAALFSRARDGQLVGEASTAYSKRPDVDGVAERAVRVLGPDLRIIYIVRDPIERIVSHYRHDRDEGVVRDGIDAAVMREPRYVNYSRYGFQLRPWVVALGAERILVLRFEEYTNSRLECMGRVCDFLRVPRTAAMQIDSITKHNASDGRPVTGMTPLGKFARSGLYRRRLKQIVPQGLRSLAVRALVPRAAIRPTSTAMKAETAEILRQRLSEVDLALAAGKIGPEGVVS